jgi:hypothetical protein
MSCLWTTNVCLSVDDDSDECLRGTNFTSAHSWGLLIVRRRTDAYPKLRVSFFLVLEVISLCGSVDEDIVALLWCWEEGNWIRGLVSICDVEVCREKFGWLRTETARQRQEVDLKVHRLERSQDAKIRKWKMNLSHRVHRWIQSSFRTIMYTLYRPSRLKEYAK